MTYVATSVGTSLPIGAARGQLGLKLAELAERARSLRALILEHRGETDQARRLAQPVVEALAELGVFRAMVPVRAGGEEWDLPTWMRVVEELSTVRVWHLTRGSAPRSPHHGPRAITAHRWRRGGSGFASVIPDASELSARAHSDEVKRLVIGLRDALASTAPDVHFNLALGARVGSAQQLADSFQQADDVLALATRLGLLDRAVLFEELGIERVLLDTVSTSSSHEGFVQEILGPLLEYDARNQRDFLATLRVYIEEGYEGPPAARRLFIHVNTLRFRLKRIAELLGGEWPHGQLRFQVELALRLLEVQALRARQEARARLAPSPSYTSAV